MHTIRPWLVRIEQAMNRALFADSEKAGNPGGSRFYVQFNLDGLMRGDYKSRMEGYAIARQNGWMSANDIRALENLNPISEKEGGSTYLVNGNMIPINLCGVTQLIAAAAAAEAAQNAPNRQEDSSQESPPKENQKKSPQRRRKPKKEEQADEPTEADTGQPV